MAPELTRDDTVTAESWAVRASRLFMPLEVTGSSAVTGRMRGSTVAGVRLSHLNASGHFGRRTRRLISDGEDGIVIALVTSGNLHIRQSGREIRLHRGNIAIYESSSEFTVGSPSRFGLALTVIPTEVADFPTTALRRMAVRRLDSQTEGDIRTDVVRLHQRADIHSRDQLIRLLGSVSPGARVANPGRIDPAEMRELIDAVVDEHLSDVGFSITDVARHLSVSRRTLYNHFSGSGETLGDTLRRRRLNHACEGLTRRPNLSVTEIALSCGFASPSHFARVFKSEFGMSPSEFRSRWDSRRT